MWFNYLYRYLLIIYTTFNDIIIPFFSNFGRICLDSNTDNHFHQIQ